ncbi:MAG: FecR family protein, partial [Bacteroidales bacterium]|nr:FecR family protein [Bacteroidales bacterium]
MNEFWKKLSERFLLNECSAQESRLLIEALRDGLIDGEFKAAIESVMQSEEMARYIDMQGDVPDEILTGLQKMISETGASAYPENTGDKPVNRSRRLPEWLRIAVAVAVTATATATAMWTVISHRDKHPEALFQTITVPTGQTVNVTLVDGTSLWLNSQTKLRYPGTFDGAKREVWLEGEGFFDVATDRNKPFVVHAGKYEVTAHGTKFNVEAYKEDSVFSASL